MLRGLPEIEKLLMDAGDELSAISGLGEIGYISDFASTIIS